MYTTIIGYRWYLDRLTFSVLCLLSAFVLEWCRTRTRALSRRYMYVVLLARVLSIYCINQRKITWECVGFHWAGRSYTAVPLAHCRDQNVAWTPRGWISILRPLRPSGQHAGSLFLGVARSLAAAAAETGTSVPGGLVVRQCRRYCIRRYCTILKILNN